MAWLGHELQRRGLFLESHRIIARVAVNAASLTLGAWKEATVEALVADQRAPVSTGETPHMRPMTTLTVWHDGTCPLCRSEIALMRKLDMHGAIRFVDASSAEPSFCPLDRRRLLARFHAEEDGKLLSGAAAFAAMWRAIPLLRPLGLAARSSLALRLIETAYRGFLVVRPSLQHAARRVSRT